MSAALARRRLLLGRIDAVRRSAEGLGQWTGHHPLAAGAHAPQIRRDSAELVDALERLSHAAARRPAIAAFGMPRGLAALIGAAAGQHGSGEVPLRFGSTEIAASRFLTPGRGAILRITPGEEGPDPTYPVALSLLTELEAAALLVAGTAPICALPARIEAVLECCERMVPDAGTGAAQGWSPPRRCAGTLARELDRLVRDYPHLAQLAPFSARIGAILARGNAACRAAALSLLWAEAPAQTAWCRQFGITLDALGHARRVWAPAGLLDHPGLGGCDEAEAGDDRLVRLRLPSGALARTQLRGLSALTAEIGAVTARRDIGIAEDGLLNLADLLIFPQMPGQADLEGRARPGTPAGDPSGSASEPASGGAAWEAGRLDRVKRAWLPLRAQRRRELCAIVDCRAQDGLGRTAFEGAGLGSAAPDAERVPVFAVIFRSELDAANGAAAPASPCEHRSARRPFGGAIWLARLPHPALLPGAGRQACPLQSALRAACTARGRVNGLERSLLRLLHKLNAMMKQCSRRSEAADEHAARIATGRAMVRRLRPCIEERRLGLLLGALYLRRGDLQDGAPLALCGRAWNGDRHARFAETVLGAWQAAARRRLGRRELCDYLGMIPAHAEVLVDELAQGALRAGMVEALAAMSRGLADAGERPVHDREDAAARAIRIVNAFVERPGAALVDGRPAIARPACGGGATKAAWEALRRLQTTPRDQALAELMQARRTDRPAPGLRWSTELMTLIEGNAAALTGLAVGEVEADAALDRLIARARG
ncbi:virulence factor SrfC family protein [Profundibacterium mesophilum]|uniref:Virulence effector protein n=1 Tax=Profundibacterium mesophilum KAUST100406-0324 TaxID=1037889 RepID=A0A921NYM6_9RHOB|nr:virulence factor SrfC family protein [Profundibacterium mesophilum]KAF0675893.1 virulence effector protein [Profundibacterium mesophilum KAUST100406-0324]